MSVVTSTGTAVWRSARVKNVHAAARSRHDGEVHVDDLAVLIERCTGSTKLDMGVDALVHADWR